MTRRSHVDLLARLLGPQIISVDEALSVEVSLTEPIETYWSIANRKGIIDSLEVKLDTPAGRAQFRPQGRVVMRRGRVRVILSVRPPSVQPDQLDVERQLEEALDEGEREGVLGRKITSRLRSALPAAAALVSVFDAKPQIGNYKLIVSAVASVDDDTIDLQSEPLWFEVRASTTDVEVVEGTSSSQLAAGGPNVLLVDDSEEVFDVVRRTLEKHGYSVSRAADGPEGLELAKATQYDLVITDVLMPDMSGLELLQALRKHEGYENLPIVLISNSTTSVRTRSKHDRWTGHVTKPFSQEDLWNTVSRLLISKPEG